MLKVGSPKPLWDHCIKLEARIRSHTALNIYGLKGQVPETLMTGQTGDISNLCEFEWFQWVMFYQPMAGYPDDIMFISRWLGPAIDVGAAMTYKILHPNDRYVCRGTIALRRLSRRLMLLCWQSVPRGFYGEAHRLYRPCY